MTTLVQRITDLAAAIRDKLNLMAPRLLPAGGTAGQVLAKTSSANYAAGWVDQGTGGGGGSTSYNFIASAQANEGRYFTPDLNSPGFSGRALSANRLFFFLYTRRLTIDALAVNITTAVAGGEIRLGIYDCDVRGWPNNLIEEAPVVDCSTIGIKNALLSADLSIGPHWVAVLCNNSSVAITGSTSGVAVMDMTNKFGTPDFPTNSGTGGFVSFSIQQNYGPLPAVYPGGTISGQIGNQTYTLAVRGA